MEDFRCNSHVGSGCSTAVGPTSLPDDPISPTESRKLQSMAFTIHFAEDNDAAASNKKLSDNFNKHMGHRRNPSLPIVESTKEIKTNVNAVRAVGLSPLMVRKCIANRRAGYHSEGYFSSDQEEDARNRADFFVKKFKNLEKGLRATNLAQEKKILSEQNGIHPSNDISPIENGEKFQNFIEDRLSPETLSSLEFKRHNVSLSSKDEWAGSDDGEEVISNDTASETGTYTIDRDTPCPEVINARLEVEKVVAVSNISCNEQNKGGNSEKNKGPNFKMSMFQDGSNWINEWASQVAKRNNDIKLKPSTLPPIPVGSKLNGSGNSVVLTRIPSPIQSPNLTPSAERKVHPSPQHTRNLHSPHGIQTTGIHNGFMGPETTRADKHSDSNSETESFLRATESVVTAMQARMESLSVDSGGESDVDTSHSYPASSRGVRRGSVPRSDSSSDADRRKDQLPKSASPTPAQPPLMRYNRAFSLRRARLDCEETPSASAPPSIDNRKKKNNNEITAAPINRGKKSTDIVRNGVSKNVKPKSSPKTEASPFSRTDCGRFSVRTPRVTPQVMPKSNSLRKDHKKGSPGGRSNSTLSSKEVEFQNWKRRKSYDPMKAAAEGKKKEAAKKATMSTSMTQSSIVTSDTSPSQQNPVLRSASFHGTGGLTPQYISSEDEVTLSADEDSPVLGYPPSLASMSPTKIALEGMFGNNKSCLYNSPSSASLRGRNKMEALDSLVLSAVCGISNKLRGTSSTFLKKLRFLYEGDPDRCDKLTAVIELLEHSPCGSPQTKSPSKELSGTLKNLKRLENVIKVLDEVLFEDDDLEIELEEY